MHSYPHGPSESKNGRRSKTEALRAFAPARRSGKYSAHCQLFGSFLFTGVRSTWHHLAAIQRPAHPARRWSGGIPTLDIAERMIEQAPGITRLLDRLERKKLVRRERPSENRRQVLCYITKPGLDLLRELDTPVKNQDNQALHRLDESEIEELIRLLELARGEQPSTTYLPAASSR